MKILIKFPRRVIGKLKDVPPDYFQFRRKYIRKAMRSSPFAKHALCKIIDVIDALRKDSRREN